MHFPKCFDYFVLTNSFWLEKIQSLLLYFKYSIFYVQLNNPKATPNFKRLNLVGIFKKNIWKHLLLLDILHIWDCLAHIIKNYRFCRFNIRIEALLKVVTYVTWHNKWAWTLTWCKRWYFRKKWIYFACFLAKVSSLWCLNLRYWCTFVTDVMNICFQYFLIWIILK